MAETKVETQTDDLNFTEKFDKMKQFAKAYDEVLQLINLENNTTKTWTIFSKDLLRTYLQNPYAATSQTNLRNLSKFLWTLSFPLRRIVHYFASLPDFSAYKINLDFSLVEENDEESLLQDYENAARFVRKMNLVVNMFKLLIIAWREDVVYFQPYQDDNGALLMQPLDSQYCKISSIGYNNLYHVAFDFAFFNGTNSFYLDVWDPEFKKKYNAYQNGSALRWQELENARAFKINSSDQDLIVPVFAGLFEPIIDLIDLQSLMAVKDSLDIYKLLVMRIPLLDSQNPDDMALSLELAKKFYNKAAEDLPDEIGLILSPMEVDSISFDKNATSDTNAIADSYENLMEQAGISQIFDARRLTGATSVKMSMMVDALTATKGIIQQVEAFANERLQMEYPNTAAYVKFIDVTTYTRDERIAQVEKAANAGLSVKLEYMSLLGYDPIEAIASDWIEAKLGLSTTRFVHPLVSSHTQSGMAGENGGAPEKDVTELSPEGEATRDSEKNDQ
jgi:hypothetical protein